MDRATPSPTPRVRDLYDRLYPDGEVPRLPWSHRLDVSCECPPMLDALMRRAIDRVILLANGPAAGYYGVERTVNGNLDKGPIQMATDEEGAILLLRRFDRARTNRERLLVIAYAQRIAKRFAKADQSRIRGTAEWERKIGLDPRPYTQLQDAYGVSSKTIARIKKAARALS